MQLCSVPCLRVLLHTRRTPCFPAPSQVYFANQHPGYPQGGEVTQLLNKVAIGQAVEFKGPVGDFVYEGRGLYARGGQRGQLRRLSMLAGGTGITPMWQVRQARERRGL